MEKETFNNPGKGKDEIIRPTATNEYVDEPEPVDLKTNINSTNEKKNWENRPCLPPAENNKAAIRANQIAFWGLWINVALAFVTILLFTKTIQSNNTAIDALKEAKKANDISEMNRKDDNEKDNYERQRQKTMDSKNEEERQNNFIRDTTTIGLAQASLRAQINSINETRREFELENRGIITITDFKIDTNELRKGAIVFYDFHDIGKFPIIITKRKNGAALSPENSTKTIKNLIDREHGWVIHPDTKHLISPLAKLEGFSSLTPFTQLQYRLFMDGKICYYVFFETEYYCLGIDKTFRNKLGYKITISFPSRLLDYQPIELEETEIPNSN